MDTAILIIIFSFFSFHCALNTHTHIKLNAFMNFFVGLNRIMNRLSRRIFLRRITTQKRSINSIVQLNWVEKFGNDTNDVYTRHVFCCVVHKKKQNPTVLVVRVMSYFKSLTAVVVHRRWTNDNFYFLLMIVVPRRLFLNWILHTVGKGASKRITYLERNKRRKRKLALGVKQNMGR